MSRSDRGGSPASNQIGLEMGSPPSAFGSSPCKGEQEFKNAMESRSCDYMSNCDC